MLRGGSGPTIVPRCLPSDEMIHSPPGPETSRVPFFVYFHTVKRILSRCLVISKNTLRFERVPSGFTWYRMTTFFLLSQLST